MAMPPPDCTITFMVSMLSATARMLGRMPRSVNSDSTDLAVADGQFAHDDRLGHELADVDRLPAARQRVLGMDDQRHLGLGQPIEQQAGRHPVGIGLDGDAGVDPLLVQVVENVLGRRGENFEAHARQDRLRVAEQPRHENLRHAGAHAERQRVERRAAQPARGVGQAQHVADHAFGFVQEGAAALGQLDAARRPAEQRETRSRLPAGAPAR